VRAVGLGLLLVSLRLIADPPARPVIVVCVIVQACAERTLDGPVRGKSAGLKTMHGPIEADCRPSRKWPAWIGAAALPLIAPAALIAMATAATFRFPRSA